MEFTSVILLLCLPCSLFVVFENRHVSAKNDTQVCTWIMGDLIFPSAVRFPALSPEGICELLCLCSAPQGTQSRHPGHRREREPLGRVGQCCKAGHHTGGHLQDSHGGPGHGSVAPCQPALAVVRGAGGHTAVGAGAWGHPSQASAARHQAQWGAVMC